MPDAEVDLIMRTIAANVQSYDQVVEVSGLPTSHAHGSYVFIAFSVPDTARRWTPALELRFVPSTRVNSRNNGYYFQRASSASGAALLHHSTMPYELTLPLGRRHLPAIAEPLPAVCVCKAGPRTGNPAG
jgi:hypothetical protein